MMISNFKRPENVSYLIKNINFPNKSILLGTPDASSGIHFVETTCYRYTTLQAIANFIIQLSFNALPTFPKLPGLSISFCNDIHR